MSEESYIDGTIVKAACDRLSGDMRELIQDWLNSERERGTPAREAIAALGKCFVIQMVSVAAHHAVPDRVRSCLRSVRNAVNADFNKITDEPELEARIQALQQGEPVKRELHS